MQPLFNFYLQQGTFRFHRISLHRASDSDPPCSDWPASRGIVECKSLQRPSCHISIHPSKLFELEIRGKLPTVTATACLPLIAAA